MTSTRKPTRIDIYTDGACKGNPGPGGYGIILTFGGHRKEISQGFERTTNNRMELLAVIVALEAIKDPGFEIIIHSDSKYVVNAVEKGWLWDWEKKAFKKKKNKDLWIRYIPLHKKLNPKFNWIKGHAGHPENERCDELAVKSAESLNLVMDTGFVEEREAPKA